MSVAVEPQRLLDDVKVGRGAARAHYESRRRRSSWGPWPPGTGAHAPRQDFAVERNGTRTSS